MADIPPIEFNPTGVWLHYRPENDVSAPDPFKQFADGGGTGVILDHFFPNLNIVAGLEAERIRGHGLQVMLNFDYWSLVQTSYSEEEFKQLVDLIDLSQAVMFRLPDRQREQFAQQQQQQSSVRSAQSGAGSDIQLDVGIERISNIGYPERPWILDVGSTDVQRWTGGFPVELEKLYPGQKSGLFLRSEFPTLRSESRSAEEISSYVQEWSETLGGLNLAFYAFQNGSIEVDQSYLEHWYIESDVFRALGGTAIVLQSDDYDQLPGVAEFALLLSGFPDTSAEPGTTPPPPPRQERSSSTILSDAPIGRSDMEGPDALGYSPYVASLLTVISDPQTSLPLSMAISAPWGSGKSSVMRWMESEFKLHRAGKSHNCVLVPNRGRWNSEMTEDAYSVRKVKTVWIDAWRYQSGAALWANFTKEIYQQGQRQIRWWFPRLKFRLALANGLTVNQSPVESVKLPKLLRRLFEYVRPLEGYGLVQILAKALVRNWLPITATLGLGAGVGAGIFYGVTVDNNVGEGKSAIMAVLAGGIPIVGGFLTRAKGIFRVPFSFDLDKISSASAQRPEPVDSVSAPADIERLVRLLTRKDEALVVFIDDLDRCSPDKVRDAVEAINLLFNGPPNAKTIFILGMDVDMVAASLRVAYRDMIDELEDQESGDADDFGHRFLSKIVQLSFYLPEPRNTKLLRYIDHLIGPEEIGQEIGGPELGTPTWTDIFGGTQNDSVARRELEERLESDMASWIQDDSYMTARAAEQVVRSYSEEEQSMAAEIAQGIVQRRVVGTLTGDSEEVKKAIRFGSRSLPPRPRDYKRFVNSMRLQLLVDRLSLNFDGSQAHATDEQIAKWTALCMRWPNLAAEVRPRSARFKELEIWSKEDGNTAPTGWPKRLRQLSKDPQFKIAIAKEPALADVDLNTVR